MKKLISFTLIFSLGLGVRLLFALSSFITLDMHNYQIVVDIIKNGLNIYHETPYYNYSPLWAFFLLAFSYLSDQLAVSFPVVTRLFLSFVDIANAFLIYYIAGKRLAPFSLYILNPVTILISSLHGMFDSLAVMPLLVAILIWKRGDQQLFVWFLGTLALLIKHITLPSVFVLFLYSSNTKRRAVIMSTASIIVFLLSFLPYASSIENIVQNVFRYKGSSEGFGFNQFILSPIVSIVFLLTIVFFPLLNKETRHLSFFDNLYQSSLAFITFAPGFYGQYIFQPVLAGCFRFSTSYALLLVVSTIHLFFYYFFWDHLSTQNFVWATCLFLFLFKLIPGK